MCDNTVKLILIYLLYIYMYVYTYLSEMCVILYYVTDLRYLIYMCDTVTESHHIYYISEMMQQVCYLDNYIYIIRMSDSSYKESVSDRQQKTCDQYFIQFI